MMGWVFDKLKMRRLVFLVIGMVLMVVYVIMMVWYVFYVLRIIVFIFCGVFGFFILLMVGWINEVCGGDEEK